MFRARPLVSPTGRDNCLARPYAGRGYRSEDVTHPSETDQDLIALSDAGYHALEVETVRRSGGAVEQSEGMLHVAGTHDAPFIVNGSMRLDRAVAPEVAIAASREWAARRGRVAGISTHGHDADLEQALEQIGWQLEVELPGMVVVEGVVEGTPGRGIDLRPVQTESDLRTLIDVLAESFGPEEPWPALWAAVFNEVAVISSPDTSAVIAYADGEPAAAAVGYALQQVGVVGMVGTIGRFGRRGLGELVTRHVTAASQRHNGRPVVLQSSPMAQPLYERIGFRAVTRYQIWVDAAGRQT